MEGAQEAQASILCGWMADIVCCNFVVLVSFWWIGGRGQADSAVAWFDEIKCMGNLCYSLCVINVSNPILTSFPCSPLTTSALNVPVDLLPLRSAAL